MNDFVTKFNNELKESMININAERDKIFKKSKEKSKKDNPKRKKKS